MPWLFASCQGESALGVSISYVALLHMAIFKCCRFKSKAPNAATLPLVANARLHFNSVSHNEGKLKSLTCNVLNVLQRYNL